MQARLTDRERREIITFGIDNHYIELTEAEKQSDQILVNKFITTLLYESNRHGWNAAHCVEIRKCIVAIQPTFANKTRDVYERYISHQETTHSDHFGSYLSDNSDSDEEASFLAKDAATKQATLKEAALLQKRAQVDSLLLKKKTGDLPAGTLRVGTGASKMFDLKERTKIHHGDGVLSDRAKHDLTHLNILLKRGNYTLEKAVAELTNAAHREGREFTNFLVAEYRGITHLTTTWNKPSRQAHRRDPNEMNKPQYSSSIYKATGISMFRQYTEATRLYEENPGLLEKPATLLKEILLTFREPSPYTYEHYSFSSLAYLLQNIYTQDYYGFQQLLESDPTMKAIMPNSGNPFFSMGDTPYHACKYAYGLKPYKGHEGDRLRPRWQKSGQPERPYSGVVYASLHPITDFTSEGPLHLISLNRNAEIKLKSELIIIAERESCFPAFLPADRVCHKHVAKYPSFKGNYKQIYAYKYGMSEAIYNKFKQKLMGSAPHTDNHRAAKQLLGEWLCSYQEVKLIETTTRLAKARHGVMVYRDYDGTFTLTPPIDSVNRNDNNITDELKQPVKAKQVLRKELSSPDKKITRITKEQSLKQICKESEEASEESVTEANITTNGNHGMSLPLSLMLNAIKNKRYLALKHFLTIPIFQACINERFHAEGLQDATLLHLAVAMNDLKMMRYLLAVEQCDTYLCAYDLVDYFEERQYSFGNIQPLHLAIILGNDEAARLMIKHDPLLIEEDLNLLSDHYDELFRTASTDDEDTVIDGAIKVNFVTRNTALHLAVLCNREAIVEALIEAGADAGAINSDDLTPIDFTLGYERPRLEAIINPSESEEESCSDDEDVRCTPSLG